MRELVVSLLSKAGLSLTGPVGWLVSLILDRFLIWAEKLVRQAAADLLNWFKELKRGKVDEKNQEHYQDVIREDGAPTQAEIDDATSDVLNGRKP